MRFLGRIKRRGRQLSSGPAAASISGDAMPERARFGYKTGWLAFRSEDLNLVADSLGLVDQQEAYWRPGVGAAHEAGVFVCPSVDGWLLAMGEGVLTGAFDAAELSRRLGCEVQVFKTHRVVEAHAWARAEGGVLVRDFEYVGESGEIVVNEGVISAAEEDEQGAADFAGLAAGPVPFDDEELVVPTEETVMAIAAVWSIDPTQLEGPDDRLGTLGRFA